MDEYHWYKELNDRTLRYGATPLDHNRVIAITASPAYLKTYDGQLAALVAANLLGRMTPAVVLAFDDVELHPALPWPGATLHSLSLSGMAAANPFGRYDARAAEPEDFRFHLGPDGSEHVVHGSGWNSYFGPAPSPLKLEASNGIGAALSVVLAAAHLFRTRFGEFSVATICNAWNWTETLAQDASPTPLGERLGNVFAVGLGSVGSAALYFLALTTRNFDTTLIDMDVVKIRNLTRSPIFKDFEKGTPKVNSVAAFLRGAGVRNVVTDPVTLHESKAWAERAPGTPDVVISAANEHEVRYHIEMGYPPIQLYATTGKNWQVTLLRHDVGSPGCSLCVFPPGLDYAPSTCATDAPARPLDNEVRVDAALPFLSFAAGLMTASEILKLSFPGFPFTAERVSLYLRQAPALVHSLISHRPGCSCEYRSATVRASMVAGSRYSGGSSPAEAP